MIKFIRIIFIRYFFLLAMLAIVLCSCSPQQRLSNIIAKHPEFLNKDSVLVLDTVIVPGRTLFTSVSDSLLNQSSPGHPIIRDSGGVKETIYRYHNTTFVKSECAPDTSIHKHYNISNNYQTIQSSSIGKAWIWYLVFYAVGILSGLILFRR